MPLDHFVTLGDSGLRVSPLCLGAMTFGADWGWGSDVSESEAILARYIERGGNFVDTANAYTKGHSEKIIGDYVNRGGVRRDQLVIATKFTANLFPGDPNAGGASRKALTAACDESLRRLQTDYIDLYWMHAWDRFTPIEETMRALDDSRAGREGSIPGLLGHARVEGHPGATAGALPGLDAADCAANRILARREDRRGRTHSDGAGIGAGRDALVAPSRRRADRQYTRGNAGQAQPGGGRAVAAYLNERTFAIIDELIRLGRELNTTPAAVALSWVQSKAGVASTIIGARRLDQLDQNLAALDVQLEADHVAALDRLSEPTLGFPSRFLSLAQNFMHAGATVNGQASQRWPMAPQNDGERY